MKFNLNSDLEFIRLNRRKLLYTFAICFLVWSIAALCIYFAFGKISSTADIESRQIALLTFAGVALIAFLGSSIGSLHYFHKTRRLFRHVIFCKVFDDGKYVEGYLNEKWWLVYTTECMYGHIAGYPVVASTNYVRPNNADTFIVLSFFIIKFNRTRYEQLSVSLANGLPDNLLATATTFANNLRAKGYKEGDVSSVSEASKILSAI